MTLRGIHSCLCGSFAWTPSTRSAFSVPPTALQSLISCFSSSSWSSSRMPRATASPLPLNEQRPRPRERFGDERAHGVAELSDLPLCGRRRPERDERQRVAQVHARAHAAVAADGEMDPRQLLRHASVERLLVEGFGLRVGSLELPLIGACALFGQRVGAPPGARLLVGSRRIHHEPLDGGQVVEVGERRVARAHLVVRLRAVPVPLAEHEDRRLHLNDEPAHLERRRVLVLPQEAQELLVAGLGVAGARAAEGAAGLLLRRRAGRIVLRPPPEEALAGAHARGLDDALVGAPRLDELHVAVIEDRSLFVGHALIYRCAATKSGWSSRYRTTRAMTGAGTSIPISASPSAAISSGLSCVGGAARVSSSTSPTSRFSTSGDGARSSAMSASIRPATPSAGEGRAA